MSTKKLGLLRWNLLCAFLFLAVVIVREAGAGGVESTHRTGPQNSPLEWTEARARSALTDDRVNAVLNQHLGRLLEDAIVERRTGLFRDRFPFWDVSDGSVERIDIKPVRVTKNEDTCWVELTLILDPRSDRLLAACTRPRSEWLLPVDEHNRGHPELLSIAKWGEVRALSASNDLTSSIPELLSLLWEHGLHPGMAGQVVMRPREYRQVVPEEVLAEVEGGEPTLPYKEWQAVWFVHVLGTSMPGTPIPYSEMVFMVNDRDHRDYFKQYIR
jgi:hypothetical protein